MFTVRIPVRDFMDHTPIDDASVAVSLSVTTVWRSLAKLTLGGTGGPPAIVRTAGPFTGLARNLGGGMYECAFDLQAAYREVSQPKPPASFTFFSTSVWGTVTVVVGGLDDTLALGRIGKVIAKLADLDTGVKTDPIGVDFAKAIVGATTPGSTRLWFAWNGRDRASDERFACEVHEVRRPGKLGGPPPFLPAHEPPLLLPAYWTVPVEFLKAHKGSNTAAVQLKGLSPGTRYRYALREAKAGEGGVRGLGRIFATGEFTTPLINPARLSFAFGSCHQPTTPQSLGRWEALAARRDYDLLLLIGDQIYGDKVEGMGATWEEQYWNRYHQYWVHRPMRQVLRRTPTYMIFDDHEVMDDWGILPVKGTGRESSALDAYDAFQQAHNPGGVQSRNYHYSFRMGPAAFFVLDLRSRRSVDGDYRVLGKRQFDDFRDWATSESRQDGARNADVVFVVTTVPIAFLPVQEVLRLLDQLKKAGADLGGLGGAIAGAALFGVFGALVGYYIGHTAAKKEIETTYRNAGLGGLTENDMADMWTLKENQPDMCRVLETLFDLANDVQDGGRFGSRPRAVFILGGDVHVGAMHEIVSELPHHARNKTIHQLISSPISHEPPNFEDMGVKVLEAVVRHVRPGKNVTKGHILKHGKDSVGLAKDLFGGEPAKFPLDDQSRKVFWANFRGMVSERNFGRVAMAKARGNTEGHRVYRFSLAIEGEGKGESSTLTRLLEIRLPNNDRDGVQVAEISLPDGVAEGNVIKAPDSPEVFLVDVGERRWIPDDATFLSRWTWDQLNTVSQEIVDAIPRGPDLPFGGRPLPSPSSVAEGDLVKGPDSPEVYLVEGGRRRWIPDDATFLSRWTWDQLNTVPNETIAMSPRGPDLPSIAAPPAAVAEGDLIKGPDDSAIFVVREGVRRWVPDEPTLLGRWSWDWVKTLPKEAVDAIPRGPDLPTILLPLPEGIAEGDVIKGPDSPEVYLVEFGERRWVPDEATFLSRWTWDQLKAVPQDVLEAIPRGPDLASSS